jgi:hypothetical protein
MVCIAATVAREFCARPSVGEFVFVSFAPTHRV